VNRNKKLLNKGGGGHFFNASFNSSKISSFLISKFRRILNVVCFVLGNFHASEFYMPTFRNILSVSYSCAGKYEEWPGFRMLGYLYGKRFGSKIA
jgi:hypothetical protein